jgi:hypothetical protein
MMPSRVGFSPVSLPNVQDPRYLYPGLANHDALRAAVPPQSSRANRGLVDRSGPLAHAVFAEVD